MQSTAVLCGQDADVRFQPETEAQEHRHRDVEKGLSTAGLTQTEEGKMAVNESELEAFQGKRMQPIGQPGAYFATRQQAGPLWKMMKAMAKMKSAPKAKTATRKSAARRHGKTRNVEADQKVHIGKQSFKQSDLY